MRSTYGAELPFVIIRLSVHQTALDAGRLAVVRAAQTAIAAADPRVGLVDTDAFGMKTDDLHFDAGGQQQIGAATGEEIVYLRWMLDTLPPAVIDASDGGWDGDYDGDRRSNGDEWVAGTLADDPTSFFSAGIVRTAPDGVEISYPASADREFAVEQWNAVLESWGEILPAEAGSGASDKRIFTSADPGKLYRVRAQLP